MDTNSLQPNDLQDRLKVLPPEIVELFTYNTIEIVVDEVVSMFGLNEDQANLLQVEVELVLSLFEDRFDLVSNIKTGLGIDEKKAVEIKQYLDENLFIIVEELLDIADSERLANESNLITSPSTSATPNTIIGIPTPEPTTPSSTPDNQQTSKPVNQIPSLRTFASDVRTHGYGVFRSEEKEEGEMVHKSSQEDIVRK